MKDIISIEKAESMYDNLSSLLFIVISERLIIETECYVEESDIEELYRKVINYLKGNKTECYIEIGRKVEEYTPVFSMNIHKEVFITKDSEIDIEFDNVTSKLNEDHFYIKTNVEMLEIFIENLKDVIGKDNGQKSILKGFSIEPDEKEKEYTYEDFEEDVRMGHEIEIEYKSEVVNYFISMENATNLPILMDCIENTKRVFKDYDELLSSKVFDERTFKEAWEDIFISCVLQEKIQNQIIFSLVGIVILLKVGIWGYNIYDNNTNYKGIIDKEEYKLDTDIEGIKDGVPFAVKRTKEYREGLELNYVKVEFENEEQLQDKKGVIMYVFYEEGVKSDLDASANLYLDMSRNSIKSFNYSMIHLKNYQVENLIYKLINGKLYYYQMTIYQI